MIHTHLIDMVCPYIHKGGKHDRVLGIRLGFFCEATVLDFDLALSLLSCPCKEVMRYSQREVVLLFEELHLVERKRNLVAFLAHSSGKVVLHLVYKVFRTINRVKNTNDFTEKLIGYLVGCCVLQLVSN